VTDPLIGPPQIAALLVLMQRGAEEIYSARNTRALMARGAREEGGSYYAVVAVAHLCWIASLFFLIPSDAHVIWPLIGLYLVLQVARYWVIGTLGPYWTHRIISIDQAPIISTGPYRYLKHPNYAIAVAETMFLPLAFSAVALAFIMTAIWAAVLDHKIRLENAALQARSRVRDQMNTSTE
jgi:methyltransferase